MKDKEWTALKRFQRLFFQMHLHPYHRMWIENAVEQGEQLMTDERYTKEEWIQKQRNENIVSSVSHSLTGCRIKDTATLNKVLNAIWVVTDPDIWRDAQ